MATEIITRADKGSPLSFTEMDTNLLNLKDAIDNISPTTLLTAIKTVDGAGSGLDAELLSGKAITDLQLHNVTGPNVAYTQLNSSNWMFNFDGALTGALKINITGLYSKTLSGGMSVRITQNNTTDGIWPDFNLYIAGNWRSSDHTWHNVEAHNRNYTGQSLSVRFATDGLDAFILIGDTTTTWNYPRLVIENITSNAIIGGYSPDFAVTSIASLSGITVNSLMVAASNLASGPVTISTSTYTVGATDKHLINSNSATVTLTLPAANIHVGRELFIKNITAFAVNSASSNVCPISSATAGTSILAATSGKFSKLVSDGTNWIVMSSN